MKRIFIILLLIFSLTSYGQSGKFNPFKLIVLKPDTAIIDESFYSDIDSVQSDYLKSYYYSIQQKEQLVNSKTFKEDSLSKMRLESLKVEIVAARAVESEVKKFKYYESLSAYSTEVYNYYFNEYEPFSTIVELPNQNTDSYSLTKLADSLKANYIVFFSNVHTEIKDGLPILKLTTSLYSKKAHKIILIKETEGDTNSRGDMWTCGNTVLSCLLINGVRTSTDEVTPIIVKAQIRQ